MKKVLLLPDTPGWAYDIIAKNIAKHFTRYQPTIKYVGEVLAKKDTVNYNDYDVVFGFFWYDMVSLGPKIYKNYNPKKTCVGIHGHNSWIKRNIPEKKAVQMVTPYAGVGCISQKLMKIFANTRPIFTPSGYAENFSYKAIYPKDKPIFLWVGDPKKTHHGDIKGYNDIIKPVFNRRNDVRLIIATKEDKIPYHKMHEFYYKGDIIICMSKNEGSPLPIIEGMACGRPIISTDVGIAPELINKKNGIIVPRSQAGLNNAISQIISDYPNVNKYGLEARKAVEPRSWKKMAANYEKLFDEV